MIIKFVFLLSIFVGLYLPDIDLKLLAILHHRSMLTHSIIIPALLLLYKPARPVVAGLCVGISIHLLADILSPMRGFALIYIPFIKKSIGGWQSIMWMVSNAIAGLYFSIRVFHKYFVAGVFGAFGLAYAIYNENSIIAFIPCLVILILLAFREYFSYTKNV